MVIAILYTGQLLWFMMLFGFSSSKMNLMNRIVTKTKKIEEEQEEEPKAGETTLD
jgi:hypothetical protein